VAHSSTKTQLNTWIENPIYFRVHERAALCGIKPSSYAALIFEKWFKDGSPPVSEVDRRMMAESAPPVVVSVQRSRGSVVR